MKFLFTSEIRRIFLQAAWTAIVVSHLVFQASADTAFMSVPLQRTGADPNASGVVTINLALNTSSLILQATNLTPGRTYAVTSGGVLRGRFVANAAGRGQLRFTQPASGGALPFSFDPRGEQFAILLNGAPVLRALIGAIGEPLGSVVREQVTLPRLVGSAGTANAEYQLLANGVRQFSVLLTNLTNSDWVLYVDGVRRGNIAVRGGSGRIAFDNLPATPPRTLNFDPRQAQVDLVRGEVAQFGGKVVARANGISVAVPAVQTRFLPPTGAAPLGLARAQLRVDRDARRTFEVALVNVPAGAYELFINGVFRGTIDVFSIPGGAGGMIFASEPVDEDELPLNFNPFASSYIIQLGGVVYFQGRPEDVNVAPITSLPAALAESLTATGLDGDATGAAIFGADEGGQPRFRVDVFDLPTGSYDLRINGLRQGTIIVQPLINNRTQGTVEFGPNGDPLIFEPRGTVVEVRSSRGVFFSHFLGAGNGGVPPARLELPLFNLGRDADGTARMLYTRDSLARQHFEVVLRNVPTGFYLLLADDIPFASMEVTNINGGTRGEIEFEDLPEIGEQFLTFDPLQRVIAIERDDRRYFQRFLPAIR